MTNHSDSSSAPRVLYIHPGPVPPSDDPRRNAVAQWVPVVDGDLVMPIWKQAGRIVPTAHLSDTGLNGFGLHPLEEINRHLPWSPLKRLLQFFRASIVAANTRHPDLVFTYGALSTGLAGWLLSRRLHLPLVLEFPGHPFRGLLHAGGRHAPLRANIAKWIAEFLVNRADHVKLLYPGQLDDLRLRRLPPATISHDFTPISLVPVSPDTDAPEILLMGYPWYLKGVDLLITAFLQIAERHPKVKLRVVGHCPDRTPFEKLANRHPRILLQKAVPHEEAMPILSRCRVFVLASRTEAMGRVLLEAMAAGRPIVASRVDGIPHYVQDGVNGLLFESENVADLAEKLDRVLSDAALRRTLGENGRRIVMEKYSEAAYARSMVTMFYEVLGRTPPDDLPGAPPA